VLESFGWTWRRMLDIFLDKYWWSIDDMLWLPLKVSLSLIRIAFMIKIEFFPKLELEFSNNGDIWIIKTNVVIFKIPQIIKGTSNLMESIISLRALNDFVCFIRDWNPWVVVGGNSSYLNLKYNYHSKNQLWTY